MAPSDRLRIYLLYRNARLATSPWQDFLIASQVRTVATKYAIAGAEKCKKGYRNEKTRGYWPEDEVPDVAIERLMGPEPKEWRKRQLRYSRIVRYLFPMIEAAREGWETAVLWEVLLTSLVETVAWWTEMTGSPPWEPDFRDLRMPPADVVRVTPGGLGFLLERADALSRGDPPIIFG